MAQKGKRDWLEPPAWWKKVKPLRWLLGGLVLFAIVSGVRSLLGPDQPEGTEVAQAPPVVPAEPAVVPPPPEELPPPVVPEPARPEPVKPEPVKPEPPKPEPTRPEPTRPEPTKPEPTKPVEPTPEPPRPEPTRPVEPTPTPAWDQMTPEQADYTRVERERLLMMDQFRSYETVDVVRSEIEKQGVTAEKESNHRKVRGTAPPYDLDTLRVKGFKHLGVEGKLTLGFFNNRLYEVEFEPADAPTYLAELRKKLPYMRRGDTGRSEYIEGHLRLASSLELAVSDVGRALHTRPFVLWQDRRLVTQRDEWDFKFGKGS